MPWRIELGKWVQERPHRTLISADDVSVWGGDKTIHDYCNGTGLKMLIDKMETIRISSSLEKDFRKS
jgi:hypothetical protein